MSIRVPKQQNWVLNQMKNSLAQSDVINSRKSRLRLEIGNIFGKCDKILSHEGFVWQTVWQNRPKSYEIGLIWSVLIAVVML